MANRMTALRNFLNGSPDEDELDENAENENEEGAGSENEEGDESEDRNDDDADGQAEEGEEGETVAAAFRRGQLAERKRMAAVFTSEAAEGRLPHAANMLAEDLSADAIIRILGDIPTGNAMSARLRQTPKKNLGSTPGGEGRDESSAKESRKKATAAVNAGKRGKTTSANAKLGQKEG